MSILQKKKNGIKLEFNICTRISLLNESYKILNTIFTQTPRSTPHTFYYRCFGSTIISIEMDEQQKVTSWN